MTDNTRKVTGNVYRIEAFQFAIVDYSLGTARVSVALLESESITGAIKILENKFPEWHFVRADANTEAWGKTVMRIDGYAMLFGGN